MKTIQVPAIAQLSTASQSILEQIQKKMGTVPNLYATIGYSAQTLKGMLDFETALARNSSYSGKEREAINLIVSQVNNCNYCLAAHTMLAQLKGFSKEETIEIRQGKTVDNKLEAVILLAQSMAANKGNAEARFLENFFSAGYDESALIELIGLISIRTLTNYIYATTQIPLDFPVTEPLG